MTRRIKQFLMRFLRAEALRRILLRVFHAYLWLIRHLRIVRNNRYVFGPALIRSSDSSDRHIIEHNEIKDHNVRLAIVDQEDNQQLIQQLKNAYRSYRDCPVTANYTVTINNARLHNRFSVLNTKNELYWDLTRHLGVDLDSNKATRTPFLGTPSQHISGHTAMIAGNDTSRNYHHWLTFGLPKIHLLHKYDTFDQLIVDNERSFHREGLELLDISADKQLILPLHSFVQCEKLTAINNPTIYGKIPLRLHEFYISLRQKVLAQTSDQSYPERIYIVRKNSREIINIDELLPLFQQYNIVPIELESLSFTEQIRLFAGVKVIIAPHGAGLTNMAFTPAGAEIIEIFHEKTFFAHYHCMSRTLGHHHTAFIARKKGFSAIAMDANMTVDPQRFADLLTSIFS